MQPGGLIRPNTDRPGEKISINAFEALSVVTVVLAMAQVLRSCKERINVISVKEIK